MKNHIYIMYVCMVLNFLHTITQIHYDRDIFPVNKDTHVISVLVAEQKTLMLFFYSDLKSLIEFTFYTEYTFK